MTSFRICRFNVLSLSCWDNSLRLSSTVLIAVFLLLSLFLAVSISVLVSRRRASASCCLCNACRVFTLSLIFAVCFVIGLETLPSSPCPCRVERLAGLFILVSVVRGCSSCSPNFVLGLVVVVDPLSFCNFTLVQWLLFSSVYIILPMWLGWHQLVAVER